MCVRKGGSPVNRAVVRVLLAMLVVAAEIFLELMKKSKKALK